MTALNRNIWFVMAMSVLAVGRTSGAERACETVGKRFTALPLLNFSSDDGTGYGFRLNLYDYDGRTIPYRRAYSAQAFFSTKGKWVHLLNIDLPEIRPGERIEIEFLYDRLKYANYFGDLSEGELNAYTREQKTFRENYPQLSVVWIRNLRLPWRLQVGLGLSRNWISPNTHTGNILAIQGPLGLEGGMFYRINTSLLYDTRDNYLNSGRGVLEALSVGYGLGGNGDFHGGLVGYEHRHFLPLREKWVLAHRFTASMVFGDVPFYELPELGGSQTIRGIPKSGIRGQGRLLLNCELRWKGIRISEKRSLYMGGLVFGDAGQAFGRAEAPSPTDWQTGVGAGVRLYWFSTIIRVDYGISENDKGLYMRFAHIF